MMDVTVFNLICPLQIIHIVYALNIHGDAFGAVSQFGTNRMKIKPAHLLEISELGYFHAVEPNLPAQAPGAQCRRFPVVLDKANVVIKGINAETLERIKVEFLNINRRRFHDYLILVVVLEAIRILTIAAVSGTA